MQNLQQQIEQIKRNSVDFVNEEEMFQKLKKNVPLKIKLGVDPSRPDLHLGHAVVLRKLREFQDMGHKVILIIGDFTARIGDPSGKTKTRPMLTKEEVMINAKSYTDQIFKVVDKEKTEIRYNGEWFDKMTFEDMLKLTSKYTVARMLERDDFRNRYNSNQPISISEFMYPIAQGYDSVVIEADVEIGGTDQLFNLLVGRKYLEEYGKEPQIVLTMPLIEGTDGNLKMSKSYDNYIAFEDAPENMYGKLMSIPDTLIIKYMKYLTDISDDQIKEYEEQLKTDSINPRDVKMILAKEITTYFCGNEAAEKAEAHFIKVFREKDIPDEMPFLETKSEISIVDLVKETKLFTSNGEIKRQIQQNGVKINDEKITDFKSNINLKGGEILRIGKKNFYKIKIS